MSIPPGAQEILSLRKRGSRPGDSVVVSVIGELPVAWLVQPDLDTDYDWMWAIGLDLMVVADTAVSADKLRRLLWALRTHPPRSLSLWLDDREQGYDVWFYPAVESTTLPREKWQWVMDLSPHGRLDNRLMAEQIHGRVAA